MDFRPITAKYLWDYLTRGVDVIAVFISEDQFYRPSVSNLIEWKISSIKKLLSRIEDGSTKNVVFYVPKEEENENG